MLVIFMIKEEYSKNQPLLYTLADRRCPALLYLREGLNKSFIALYMGVGRGGLSKQFLSVCIGTYRRNWFFPIRDT